MCILNYAEIGVPDLFNDFCFNAEIFNEIRTNLKSYSGSLVSHSNDRRLFNTISSVLFKIIKHNRINIVLFM